MVWNQYLYKGNSETSHQRLRLRWDWDRILSKAFMKTKLRVV
jgi:hypothetical protein